MRWKPVRGGRVQPPTGTYSEWKEQIAVDCENQCLYCAISESRYGGIDNFHVDHFRPKSIYDHLEQDINNLYLACAVCNRFKSDAWPCDPQPDNSHCGFPDPAVHHYDTIFRIDAATFEAGSACAAGSFTIERLYLNRPQLLRERRAFSIEEQIDELAAYLKTALNELSKRLDDPAAGGLLHQASVLYVQISDLSRKQAKQKPYATSEVKRPKKMPAKKAPKKAAKKTPKKIAKAKRPVAKGTRKWRPRSGDDT